MVTGYVGDNEATVATFSSDGWLKTGDICYFDSEGFLFIVDRLKELIKYKAYQVMNSKMLLSPKLICRSRIAVHHSTTKFSYLIHKSELQVPPAELERVLHSIPGIADAAVIPYASLLVVPFYHFSAKII